MKRWIIIVLPNDRFDAPGSCSGHLQIFFILSLSGLITKVTSLGVIPF
jgi:hypothetical protein